jgi:hypothetical protein
MQHIQVQQTIVKQVTRFVTNAVPDDDYEDVMTVIDLGLFDPDQSDLDFEVVEDDESVDDVDESGDFRFAASW